MTVIDMIHNNFSGNRATIEKWLAYPRQLQMEYGINPVLAGGAVRDILLGGGVNDLDVFISMSKYRMSDADMYFDEEISEIAEREGWVLDEPTTTNSKYHHTALHSVWSFKSKFIEQTYNISVLENDVSSQQLIKDFDFGINMVAVNPYSILAVNRHFIEDVEKQQITIRNEESRDRTLSKYDQLSKKYPYPLVTPEGVQVEKPNAGLILPPGV